MSQGGIWGDNMFGWNSDLNGNTSLKDYANDTTDYSLKMMAS